MESKQQTAVDYFFDKIKSNFEHDGDKLESVTFLYAICKEKEREQIYKSFDAGSAYAIGSHADFKQTHPNKGQYYEQTYGTDKN